ncbi:MAG: acetyltransferase-like isoleucine patch superfamily enzyme [Cocleimonas sp.]|jgi:acetyltransferase-like isoleucine patch superfamily enzyme
MYYIFILFSKIQRVSSEFYWSLYGRFVLRLIGCKLGKHNTFYGKVRTGSSGIGIVLGDNCSIGVDCFLSVSKNGLIDIGNNVSFNTGLHLVAMSKISIGEGSAIAEYVSIRDQNHKFSESSKALSLQGYSSSPISIGKNVWIGRGCFIGAGVKIGDGAVIGANSVVVCDIPARSLAVGSPAKVIRKIENI